MPCLSLPLPISLEKFVRQNWLEVRYKGLIKVVLTFTDVHDKETGAHCPQIKEEKFVPLICTEEK